MGVGGFNSVTIFFVAFIGVIGSKTKRLQKYRKIYNNRMLSECFHSSRINNKAKVSNKVMMRDRRFGRFKKGPAPAAYK